LVPIAPTRGLIVDRNGVVIAQNVSAYTLELQPGRIEEMEQTMELLVPLKVDIGSGNNWLEI
jgi:penicillin-binding protein 2